MTAPATDPRPDPPAGPWVRSRTPSGARRCEHAPTRSVVFFGRDTTEGAIAHRLAEAEAAIARLQRRSAGG